MQIGYIYKDASGDCSNGGISGGHNYVAVYGAIEPYQGAAHTFLGQRAPAVRLVAGNSPGTIKAVVIDKEFFQAGWPMMGGCFISSSDSRFGDMGAEINPNARYLAQAVPLHDRYEP